MGKMKYVEDELALLEQWEEDGYVERTCPECGDLCEPSELDSYQAFCSNCDKAVKVRPLI